MAFFSLGGNVGFALGPLVACPRCWRLTDGGLVLALPGLAVAALLLAARPHLTSFAPSVENGAETRGEPGQPRALALLIGVIALRSVAHMGSSRSCRSGRWRAGTARRTGRGSWPSSLRGRGGTLVGGPLADRFGRRPVLRWSFVVAAPLILVYVLVGGVGGEIALIVSGAAVIGTFGVSLVMSQEYMPGRVGMASGLSIGFCDRARRRRGPGARGRRGRGRARGAALLATAAGPARLHAHSTGCRRPP